VNQAAHSFALAFTAIFVALDVVGVLPMYLGMTAGLSKKQRARVVNTSMLVALGVALFFIATGLATFRFLGIEIYDFRIAGGIVLLILALSDLAGGPDFAHGKASGSTGIVPLGVPLITGPGVLMQLILLVGSYGYAVTLAALFANYLLAWGILRKSEWITRLIGKDGTVVVSKIAALLLAAIAISMIRTGVLAAYHAVYSP